MISDGSVIVTTSHGAGKNEKGEAKTFASDRGFEYLPRGKICDIQLLASRAFVYVFSRDRTLSVRRGHDELFFHPSVAKIRMLNILHGHPDHLISSLQIAPADSVLDTTLGLGTEAILIAAFLDSGSVTALEESEHIFNVVGSGLEHYPFREAWMIEASSKITLVRSSYREFLNGCRDSSFDIVYCDPMFERPKIRSSSMNALRPFASNSPPSEKDIRNMKKTARKRVVFKVRETDRLLNVLLDNGFEQLRTTSNGISFLVAEAT